MRIFFFFFISKRPSRGAESLVLIKPPISAHQTHPAPTQLAQTVSVERRHNLKLLKLRKHFACVISFTHSANGLNSIRRLYEAKKHNVRNV